MQFDLHSKLVEIPNLSLLDMMLLCQKLELSKKITINKKELGEIMGKPQKRINALLNNKIIPEHLIVGGYSAKKQRSNLMFFTKDVLEWMKRE